MIAIIEKDGFVYNPNGLDITALKKHYDATGSILGVRGADSQGGSPMDGLELDCDILIPAATEKVLTKANANKVRSHIDLHCRCHGAMFAWPSFTICYSV